MIVILVFPLSFYVASIEFDIEPTPASTCVPTCVPTSLRTFDIHAYSDRCYGLYCARAELYLAIIAEMQCKDMKAVVHFLDGDHALVGRKCMRYFKPYAFGETVNVRLQDGSNTWHAAQFLESVKSSNSTLRPVRVRTDAGDIVRVEPRNIRRILDDTEDDDNGDDDDDEEGDDDEYDGEDAGETYFLSIDEDYNSRRANDDDEDE
uniref:Tudor domain-containing protein n=1 Tax=Craspedostauros australis TaxID=1486917 RepID=A0A7R9ZTE5_9STRA|mmetsp:Transcript_9512/g.25846  ORF Transcript_9512/g.25846 Transcript_9512/m.25846 type:complete len:206 (+) Transcript_9512:156-773(+)